MNIVFLRLLLFVCFAFQTVSAQPLSENRITGEVSTLLQWKTFWEGPQSLANYRAGMVTDASVVSSDDEIAVFIGDLRTAIYLTVEHGDIVRRVIAGMSMASTSASVEKYLKDKNGVPGFVLVPGAPEQPRDVPIRKNFNERISETRVIHLRLPAVAPPKHVLSKTVPVDLVALTSAARERIRAYHDPGCGEASVTIPRFSADDPTVYVYVDFGKGCEAGIFPFGWNRTKWIGGQFSPNRPPNDWSYTIVQVRKYSLAQFSLP